MTYPNVTKRTVLIVLLIIFIVSFSYWFFTKTNRGSSWALYSVAGWHAPLSVKINCAKETDMNVAEKFARPLKFDTKSKNELRGFWYYSYYRQCLFKNGYDFSGNLVPPSTITQKAEGVMEYSNPFMGIILTVPTGTTIDTDNLLDVDFDDRLYVSRLIMPNGNLTINAYKEADDPELLTRLKDGLIITLPDKTIVNYLGTQEILNTISTQVKK